MKCAEINETFGKTQYGEILVEFYVGGFLTGINKGMSISGDDDGEVKDIGNMIDVQDFASSVFRYCSANPKAEGATAITDKIERILDRNPK
jgi:hypothetical protein